jgi:hypothetical protein
LRTDLELAHYFCTDLIAARLQLPLFEGAAIAVVGEDKIFTATIAIHANAVGVGQTGGDLAIRDIAQAAVRIDGVQRQCLIGAIGCSDDRDFLVAEAKAVTQIDVVHAAVGERLHALAGQVIDVQALFLVGADDQAARRIGGMDPDRRIVRRILCTLDRFGFDGGEHGLNRFGYGSSVGGCSARTEQGGGNHHRNETLH